MADLTLRNGIVVTPNGLVRGGLSATGGVITHVGADSELPAGATDIDAAGKYLLPGLIDPHVHLGIGPDAGPEKLERDFVTESGDAAAGGVTTMITTTLFGAGSRGEAVELAIGKGDRNSAVDYRLTAVVTTREQLAEMNDLVRAGLRSFKFFLGYKGPQAESFGMNKDGISWDFFYQACEAIGAAGAKAFPTIHAEDPWVRDYLTERMRGVGSSNKLLQTWLEASPNILEPMQIYPAALIAHEVGTPVYVVHTSAWQSVDLIRDLKDKGWQVFGETIAAFLYWTAEEADAKGRGAFGKIQPPIRRSRDRDALWRGVLDGTISSIGTDCQMYPKESRQGDFWDAQVGLGPGMGTMLPALYTAGVLTGRCTIEDVVRATAENTARRFDLYPQKGALSVGSDADVVVFDPDKHREVRAETLKSAAGYSLYEGQTLTGWPAQVFVRGHLVFDNGRLAAGDPIGRHVPAT